MEQPVKEKSYLKSSIKDKICNKKNYKTYIRLSRRKLKNTAKGHKKICYVPRQEDLISKKT